MTALQAEVLADCLRTGGRFAILDAVLTADTVTVEDQRAKLNSQDGALAGGEHAAHLERGPGRAGDGRRRGTGALVRARPLARAGRCERRHRVGY